MTRRFSSNGRSYKNIYIDLLVESNSTVNEIVESFEISWPAISKHIKILNEHDLVIIHRQGTFLQNQTGSLFKMAERASRYRKL